MAVRSSPTPKVAAAENEPAGLPRAPTDPTVGTGGSGGTTGPVTRGRVWVTNPSRAGLLGWLLRYYTFAAVVLLLGAGVGVVSLYRHFAAQIPELEDIEQYEALAPGVTRIYGRGGVLLAELAKEHRAYAPYRNIPPALVHAFLAAEDRRFFEHAGLDYRGLARAALANLRSGTVAQGGSTITQQVAKGFLSDEQTLERKIREAILSVRMESHLAKAEILEIYMNKIFLGHGAYGVGAAASRYFDKDLSELTLAECALIAGLAKAPSRYSPVSHPERALQRRAVVLQDMVEAGYITPEQQAAAAEEPLHLAEERPDVFRLRTPYYAEQVRQLVAEKLGEESLLSDGLQIEAAAELPVQSMAAHAVDDALRRMDHKQGWRGPVTHLDAEDDRALLDERLQAEYGPDPVATRDRWRLGLVTQVNKYNAWVDLGAVEAILPLRGMAWAYPYDRNSGINDLRITDVRDALIEGDVVWVRRASDDRQQRPPAGVEDLGLVEVELGQTPRVEAALYTAEHDTGYVVAIQGGHDYDRSQFNRTIQSCRQPGSVFKAIYYALALDGRTYAMDTLLEDHPYEPEPGEEWNPQNIHGTISGQVLLRNAFIFSLNLPSIRLFMRLGADAVVAWARRLGFTTELIADKALSLGASCVRMDELSRAFGIYVREGRSFDPVYVRRIVDKRGKVVWDQRHPSDAGIDVAGRLDAMARLAVEAPPTQVIDRRTAFLITRMLRDVVTGGIGGRARRIGVPAGGKSGTASKNTYTTDTWFVGFTSRYVTAAWMGDDEYERSMGDEEASYTTATPMWTDYMEQVVAGIPHQELTGDMPPGVHAKTVDFEAGGSTKSAVMYFID